MSTKLIIARHGNTFTKYQTPTRVGAHTDLPLVEFDRSNAIGKYLIETNQIPDIIFTSPLSRTVQTAMYVMKAIGKEYYDLKVSSTFTEIDYGLDENKTEDEVEYRLGLAYLKDNNEYSNELSQEQIRKYGKQQINLWNTKAIPPLGWKVNPTEIIEQWQLFADRIIKEYKNKTVLVLTSNGIARFSPYILNKTPFFIKQNTSLKITTGGICVFQGIEDQENTTITWENLLWNFSPYNYYKGSDKIILNDNTDKNQ